MQPASRTEGATLMAATKKPAGPTQVEAIVHGEKRSFVANTIADIADVFPDHQLIASLGCGSVFNLPVLEAGELAATINMLAAPGHYTADRVKVAEWLLNAPARLCWRMAHLIDLQSKKPD